MMAETISAALTGLGGLVTAAGGIYVLKNKQADENASANYAELLSLRKDVAILRRKDVLYARWQHTVEMKASKEGFELPPFGSELALLLNGEDDEPSTGSFRAQQQQTQK